MAELVDILILVLVAFVPSLVYLVWIRNTEKYSREPYGRLLRVFVFGATIAIVIAIVLELAIMAVLGLGIERLYEILGANQGLEELILVCIIAPFVEEMTKGLGVFGVKKSMLDIEDGIVYGAASGLGFAATENMFYESYAYFNESASVFVALAVVRSLSSALLHAGASSVFGLGISRSGRQRVSWLPYYLAAVAMHGLFNFAASFGPMFESDFGDNAYLIGLAAAFLIAAVGISMARSKIRQLERGASR
ncbi:MAG TPA: PrsW family intramembrane metalloprotease [Thermoplasmata archaeon]